MKQILQQTRARVIVERKLASPLSYSAAELAIEMISFRFV
jgi:hypothetical protein